MGPNESLLVLDTEVAADIATEWASDRTVFKLGDVCIHDHIRGRFRRQLATGY